MPIHSERGLSSDFNVKKRDFLADGYVFDENAFDSSPVNSTARKGNSGCNNWRSIVFGELTERSKPEFSKKGMNYTRLVAREKFALMEANENMNWNEVSFSFLLLSPSLNVLPEIRKTVHLMA